MYKRSTAATASATALAEPEEVYASAPAAPEPVPAPVGALHRAFPEQPAAPHPPAEEEYVPQRGSYGMRLRGGLPRSLGGRILLASAAFLLLGFVILTIAAVRRFLLHDPRFAITTSSEIAVEGNEHISRPDVMAVFGSDLQRNIFKIPLAERRADLERLPWVAHATIQRLLPNHLRITVTERTPVAFVREGTHIGLVDAAGVILDMPPDSAGDPHYSFPVLTGLAQDDTPELRASRMEVYRRFITDLDGTPTSSPRRSQALSEVDVTNPEDVKALVTLGGSDILVHFGDTNFLPRFQAFQGHLPEWRTQYPRLASADMRYERQVVLEMQNGNAPLPGDDTINSGSTPKPPAAHLPTTARAVSAPRGASGHAVAAPAHKLAGASLHHPAVRLSASEEHARQLALRQAAEARTKAGARR